MPETQVPWIPRKRGKYRPRQPEVQMWRGKKPKPGKRRILRVPVATR